MVPARLITSLALFHAMGGVSGSAFANLSAGPELSVGALHAGPTDKLPGAALVADGAGSAVAAYLDARSSGYDEYQLFAQRLGVDGTPLTEEVLVATGVYQYALFRTELGPLLLFTLRSPSSGPTLGVFVGQEGSVDGPFELAGLNGLPTALACQYERCIAATGAGFQRLDLGTKAASLPFAVPATDAFGPGNTLVATLGNGDEVVAVASGTVGDAPFLLSAELDFDGTVRRPFESLGVAGSELSRLGLIAGSDGFLVGTNVIDQSYVTRTLRLLVLDRHGRLVGSESDVPLEAANSWKGAWLGGAYHLLLGGNTLHGIWLVPGSAPLVSPFAPVSFVSVEGAAAVGDAVLYSLGGTAGPGTTPSNLISNRLDGSTPDLPPLGIRPSQQLAPLLAGNGDRYLVAYQEHEASKTPVRYALLDADGKELGMGGKVNLAPESSGPDRVWTLERAGDGFLLSRDGSMALVDTEGNAAPVTLALPADDSRSSVTPVAGGGVVLALGQHGGGCGEDCGWSDVSAQRFALDGSSLDAAPLFSPPAKPRGTMSHADPRGVWSGREFVVFSLGAGIEFRRVGVDGALVDDGWRELAPTSGGIGAYAVASGHGVTLAVWTSYGSVRAARVFASGTTDQEPLYLARLRSQEERPTNSLAPDSPCAVTYDGTRFVVAWLIDGVEHAVPVSSDGTIGPVVALTSPSSAPDPHGPSLASLGDGHVLLAYDRFDAEPSALTSRARLRVLADGPAELGSECSEDADCASSFCVEGVCASEADDAPDAGLGSSCDPVKLVCIPPAVAPRETRHSGGCSCRTALRENAFDMAPWLFAALVTGRLRARFRRRASREQSP